MANEDPTTQGVFASSAAPAGLAQYGDDDLLAPGTRAGDFVIVEALASGGCGTVYRASHVRDGRIAAIKVLSNDLSKSPEMVLRFLREAQAVNQIRHPNIIDIDDYGLLGSNRPYLQMEYLAGTDLADHIRTHGRVTPQRCLEIMDPICRALDAAHRAGFVHRDVKASNVFLARQGGKEVVKLLDFGIAKLLNPLPGEMNLTRTRHVLGSAQTMSPEQILAGQVTPATDVYGIGSVLFLLLVGRYPFAGLHAAELERKILDARPPRASEIVPMSPALDDVIGRCLEKRPEDRYATTAELLDDLRAAITATASRPIASAAASAVYLELRADGSDDDALDAVESGLELAEKALVEARFIIVVSTSSSLLAVKLPDAGAGEDARERQTAAALAADLYGELAQLDPAVACAITVHAGQVRMAGNRPVGGPLLEVATWAPWRGPGAFATPDALRGVVDARLIVR